MEYEMEEMGQDRSYPSRQRASHSCDPRFVTMLESRAPSKDTSCLPAFDAFLRSPCLACLPALLASLPWFGRTREASATDKINTDSE